MTTTAQAFEQLLEDITPPPYQRTTLVPARQRRVEENLTASFPSNSDMPFVQTHLMGSAAKNTALRPLDDIDVLAEFNGIKGKAWLRYQYDSRRFLYRVRDAYNGLEARPVGARGQAVRVFFLQGGYVDVAPVFRWSDDFFVLPDGSGGWLRTSPPTDQRWFAKRNAELGYQLPAVVRLLKQWNIMHSKRLRSYHLETVVGTYFTAFGTNHRQALELFFRVAGNYLTIADPGQCGGDLSTYLGWGQRQDVQASFARANAICVRALGAEAQGRHTEAKRQWSMIFGRELP